MSKRALPRITHLQFLVLEGLSASEQSGRDLRELLAAHRIRRTPPAFYQMMARLEDAGLIDGWYDQQVVDGQLLKERRYRLTGPGRRALDETRAFYRQYLAAGARTRPSDA